MTDKPVSIIVPIYNAKGNLGRCLDSITEQTIRDIEIILVDDGSDDGSQSVCDNYANKDTRIKVVHTEHKGTANACNMGINLSSGKYIGFVDPHDWIEKEMYEYLYSQALKSAADVVTNLYYLHEENEKTILNDDINSIENNTFFNTKLTNKNLFANFFLKNHPYWCSIYRRQFLSENKISFNPKAGSNQSIGFLVLVYGHMNSFYIFRASFYHHYVLKEQPKNGYDIANDILNEHTYIFDVIEKYDIQNNIIQAEAAKSFFDIKRQLRENCDGYTQRKEFLLKSSAFFGRIFKFIEDNGYLSKDDKRQLRSFTEHPERSALLNRHNLHMRILRFLLNVQIKKRVSFLKIFNLPVVFIKRTNDYRTCNLFNIPIKRIRKNTAGSPGEVRTRYHYFGVPLLKRVDTQEEIKFYFAGIRVYKTINIQAQLTAIMRRLNQIPTQLDLSYHSNLANTVAAAHSKIFPQLKNSNTGKSVAIVATGPSMKYSPLIKNCTTIACNRAFELFKDQDPTYILAEDYLGVRDFFNEMVSRDSEVYLGCYISRGVYTTLSIPEQLRNGKRIHKYYIYNNLRTELESNPLAAFGTIVHDSLHFALYTNPDIIYLLGCDTSNSGYANKNILQVPMDPAHLVNGYIKFRDFRDQQYPNTRIISVNPIGLRGVFEDVYTEEFVKDNPELDKTRVTIVEEI